ncbi:MAG TPA: HAD family hydrolase [Rhodocyclaceae bacterium]|nr:MAG: HAD family hydrolase [Betaproteobacteria bacterium CG2_30_68_42]PIV72504.1 MAG: HAD family hydrolase [Rhodocyclales bacterium CG17_big_fil_post_rev_8_21_14_2_50_68_7]PJA58413.1 MAG: HAD family hydrolase [Rhodocyclales bacterium CG_4_9_14_3_um_filter_68_10]HCX34029.1 HAD family hydrolase [Rhodocyclaceae bacterium]
MKRRLDLVVFDWDGTLLDSTAAIVRAILSACADLGIDPPGEAAARHVIGLGLEDALAGAMPWLDPRDYPRLAERFRHHYLAQDHLLSLYPGAERLIARLRGRGYLLGIATGKTRLGLRRALVVAGLEGRFAATRCADECRPKPHPAMLLDLMAQTGVAPARTLMVGDTTHDVKMAHHARVSALAVSYGAHSREMLAQERPLDCVDTVEALAEWFEANG